MFVIQPEFEMQHRNLIYIRSQNHQKAALLSPSIRCPSDFAGDVSKHCAEYDAS
jgi:hypothetical protein